MLIYIYICWHIYIYTYMYKLYIYIYIYVCIDTTEYFWTRQILPKIASKKTSSPFEFFHLSSLPSFFSCRYLCQDLQVVWIVEAAALGVGFDRPKGQKITPKASTKSPRCLSFNICIQMCVCVYIYICTHAYIHIYRERERDFMCTHWYMYVYSSTLQELPKNH